MFAAEAIQSHDDLNRLFTELESNPGKKKTLESIFRIVHTLKGNSMALGIEAVGELSHVMEDILDLVREKKIEMDEELFNLFFRANDKLSELIGSLTSEDKVSYKGLVAKLDLYLEEAKIEIEEDAGQIDEIIDSTSEVSIEEPELDIDDSEKSEKINFSDQIQIPVKKLDHLMNLVGELIIEKDTVIANKENHSNTKTNFKRLNRITSDIQYAIMDARLVQVDELFTKFHRISRDISMAENKKVSMHFEGSDIEIDRNILKGISDSLIHLVRNAISHGIESPDERLRLGKSETGNVTLRAENDRDSVIISVEDDGKGLDAQSILEKAIEKNIISKEYANSIGEQEAINLIFESGFSSAKEVTDISGRGIGMDVVKKSVESIGGQINIFTNPGQGSQFKLRLPTSMSVKGSLLFEQKGQEFAIPLTSTIAVVSLKPTDIFEVGDGLMTNYLGQTIMLVFLQDLFESDLSIIDSKPLQRSFNQLPKETKKINAVILNYNNRMIGLVVDKLLQQKEIVEKPLHKPVDQNPLFSGATILGNGNVCMVLNVAAIGDKLQSEKKLAVSE